MVCLQTFMCFRSCNFQLNFMAASKAYQSFVRVKEFSANVNSNYFYDFLIIFIYCEVLLEINKKYIFFQKSELNVRYAFCLKAFLIYLYEWYKAMIHYSDYLIICTCLNPNRM